MDNCRRKSCTACRHKGSSSVSRLPVTVCVPVRNEEMNLPTCLKSLEDAFAEVVVIDSGSTDQTGRIAHQFGALVLQFQWNGQFPKKRNWALRNYEFKTPWVLFLDADERLTSEVITELSSVLSTTEHAGYWLRFDNWFMGKMLRHGDVMRKLALFRVGTGEYEQFPEHWWSHLDMEVHEHPVLNGTVGELDARLQHHDHRDLEHFISKHNAYSTWEANRFLWFQQNPAESTTSLTPRQRFKYHNLAKWWLPWLYFIAALILKLGFLDGITGVRFARFKFRYFEEIRMKIIEKQQRAVSPPR